MSLVRIKRSKPPYAMMRGTSSSVGAVTTALFPFANTFVSSHLITRNSATRVTVQESGFYELVLPLEIRAAHGSGSIAVSVQTGVNGTFTTRTTSPSTNDTFGFMGIFAIILELNKGDFVEIRSLTSSTPTSHIVYCNTSSGTTTQRNWIYPPSTIKRL